MNPEGKNLGSKHNVLIGCKNGSTTLVIIKLVPNIHMGTARVTILDHNIRTCPSFIWSMSTIKDSPSNAYKHMIQDPKCVPSQQPVLLPRNPKQIKNVQANQRQSASLSLTHG